MSLKWSIAHTFAIKQILLHMTTFGNIQHRSSRTTDIYSVMINTAKNWSDGIVALEAYRNCWNMMLLETLRKEADKINPGFWYLIKGKLRYCSSRKHQIFSQSRGLFWHSERNNKYSYMQLSNDQVSSLVRSRKLQRGGQYPQHLSSIKGWHSTSTDLALEQDCCWTGWCCGVRIGR